MSALDELVYSYNAEDKCAWDEIIRLSYPIVKKVCRKYFLIGADAEDLHQECMIGLMRAVRSYKKEKGCSFQTYAYICIDNEAKTAVRKYCGNKNKALNDGVSLIDVVDLPSGTGNPEAVVIRDEGMDELKQKAAELLSKGEKEIFDLYICGLSRTEIEQRTGKSEKAVDNALQRIRKKFRETNR